MLVVSGHSEETQWFDYVTGYFAQPTRIEWDIGTMLAVLPTENANFLISRKYARPMTEAERAAYDTPLKLSTKESTDD